MGPSVHRTAVVVLIHVSFRVSVRVSVCVTVVPVQVLVLEDSTGITLMSGGLSARAAPHRVAVQVRSRSAAWATEARVGMVAWKPVEVLEKKKLDTEQNVMSFQIESPPMQAVINIRK